MPCLVSLSASRFVNKEDARAPVDHRLASYVCTDALNQLAINYGLAPVQPSPNHPGTTAVN